MSLENPIKDNPNFFQITRLPIEQSVQPYRLSHLFRAVIELSSVTFGINDMQSILLLDLDIPEINLRQPLLNLLEATVLHYCKTWKGWEKSLDYYRDEFNYHIGFLKIVKFLKEKCKVVIENSHMYIREMLKFKIEKTELPACPYKLIIGGPPSILNTLVAVIKNDDILIKQHKESPLTKMTMTQILNWPYVSVEVKLLDLHLKRVNTHNIQRYITKANENIPVPESEFISEVIRLSSYGKPYTHTFFIFYFIQLFKLLQTIKGIKESRIKELQSIYNQFLMDVKDMNIAYGSMCSNTTIKFNIGKQKYSRTKLMLGTKNENTNGLAAVNYVEHIIPQIDLTLHSCSATQDMSDTKSVTFNGLNAIINRINNINDQDIIKLMDVVNNSCITYSCTFCYKMYTGSEAMKEITIHFAQQHKLDHLVVCFKCSKHFQLHVLTGNRWNHSCI